MRGSIFRKAALERLSSPERLDQLMQVTRPRAWLAQTRCPYASHAIGGVQLYPSESFSGNKGACYSTTARTGHRVDSLPAEIEASIDKNSSVSSQFTEIRRGQ